MDTHTPTKKVKLTGLEARAALPDAWFTLPEEKSADMKAAMTKIRIACHEACQEIKQALEGLGKDYFDMGRAIHSMDLIQQAKNAACDAIFLANAYVPAPTPAAESQ